MQYSKKALPLAILASGAMLAAGAGTAAGASHARSTTIKTPKLTVTISKNSFTVKGPKRFSAGRVDVTLIAKGGEQEVGFARLHKGYTYADASKDFQTFFTASSPSPEALAALNRVAHKISFYGGIDSGTGGKTVSGSVVLPKAGKYLVLNDENGPGSSPPVKLHVGAKKGRRVAPASTATVTATSAKRFGGAKVLPASGTITFKNKSTNSPHFLFMQHVKEGTTRKQVIKALNSDGPPTGPNFQRSGGVGTDVVSMGQSQTLTYTLPKGEYVEMCFFPDLQTGMPHAMMGMVRVVHLK